MSVQAWKNPEFRRSLSAAELAELPANPAGESSLSSDQLASVSGGSSWVCIGSATAVSALFCNGTNGVNSIGCC